MSLGISRSGSVHGRSQSSAYDSDQVNPVSDRSVNSLHASSANVVPTSSTQQHHSDDRDGTPTVRLTTVTSYASGPNRSTAISPFSKDFLSTTVLISETQSLDPSSAYQFESTHHRLQESSVSSTNFQSSSGDNKDRTLAGDHVIKIPQSSRSSGNVDDVGLEVTRRIITPSQRNGGEVKNTTNTSKVIDSRSDSHSVGCINKSQCSFSSELSPSILESSIQDSIVTSEVTSISPSPVVVETTVHDDQPDKPNYVIRHDSGGDSKSGVSTSDSISVGVTYFQNLDTSNLHASSTKSNQPSEFYSSSYLLSSSPESYSVVKSLSGEKEPVHSSFPDSSIVSDQTLSYTASELDSSSPSTNLKTASGLFDVISLSTTDTSGKVLLSDFVSHSGYSERVLSEPQSITNETSILDHAYTSITSKTALIYTASTMMNDLKPTQTPSFETQKVSKGSSSSTLTPALAKSTIHTTGAIKSTSILTSLTTSSDISSSKTSVSVLSSGNPNPATKSSQIPSLLPSTVPSTPPLPSQGVSGGIDNIANDRGVPLLASSVTDQSLPGIQSDLDVGSDINQSFLSSTHSIPHSQSAFVQPSPKTVALVPTPTFQPSVSPTTSVTSGGQRNGTLGQPGKLDNGFMSGSTPIIVGAACGVFVVGVIIILTVACALRRKNKKAPKRDPRMDDLWVDIGRGDDRLPAPSVNTCLDTYDTHPAVTSDQLYKATQDYVSNQDGYLSFLLGDLLRITEVSDNDWWRGVCLKDETTGWFPSHYVIEVNEDEIKTEELFPVEDEAKMDIHGQVSSFQIRKNDQDDTKPLVSENLAAHGNLEQAKDITEDVASWVKMAASVSMTSLRSIETIGTCSTVNDYATSAKGLHFRAIYSYKPVCKGEMSLKEGELVICKERDRNGWMLGMKPRTKEEGWFPAVYVDGVSSEDASLREEDMPATYELLDSNKLHNVSQPWTGIEHKAVRNYSSDMLGDLNFQCDDVIVVFQTLVNGWWFGSIDKTSGWFPGAYVEMIVDENEMKSSEDNDTGNASLSSNQTFPYQKDIDKEIPLYDIPPARKDSDNLKHPELSSFFSFSDSPRGSIASQRDSIASSVISDNDLKPLVSPKHATMDGRFKKAIRPHRKAPAPPTSMLATKSKDSVHTDGTNSLRRPVRRAPAPPSRQNSKAESDTKSLASTTASDAVNPLPFKKRVLLINGKKPKLVKVSPDIFDDKCLNPVIRPATRGLAPVLGSQASEKTASPSSSHGNDSHKGIRNNLVERRSKSRPHTPLHLRIAEHRNSSASRTSYGSNTDTITYENRNSPTPDFARDSMGLSRSSTPTLLLGPSGRSNRTLTTVPPPIVPSASDPNCDSEEFPAPPPEDFLHHTHQSEISGQNNDNTRSPPSAEISQQHDGNAHNTSTSHSNGVPPQNKDNSIQDNGNNGNSWQYHGVRRMSSNQKTAPSTLPKPRLSNNKSPLSSFGKGPENGATEEKPNTADIAADPTDYQRRPSQLSKSDNGAALSRESLALIPGKVSEIVHHINSMSPQSAFPQMRDGTELSLIIPQRKQSNVGPGTPDNTSRASPNNLGNGHDLHYQDQGSYTQNGGTTQEVTRDLSNISKEILQKNTFVPIKDNLHEIEDRVSTFRSLPRPSKKNSKDGLTFTLALEGDNYSHGKSDQHFPFFKPSNLNEKVTEL